MLSYLHVVYSALRGWNARHARPSLLNDVLRLYDVTILVYKIVTHAGLHAISVLNLVVCVYQRARLRKDEILFAVGFDGRP